MINKNNIYFSFDDWYPKDLEFAKELKRRWFNNLTFYVPIKNIEWKECLTSDQIRELSKLWEIWWHTFNHVDLMTIPLGKVEDEVKKWKEELEKITWKKINSFCYPRWHFNKKIENIVNKCWFNHSRSARLFNFHKMNLKDFVEHPNIHFYPHSRLIDILHCIKNLDFYSLFWRFRYIYLSHYEMIYKILEKNWCVNIWGHTWEIDKKEFDKMVDVLDSIINSNEKNITNK